VKGWADDPELVATFRAEVNERIASLCEGLLRLERDPAPKRNIAALFRDAHTVKGSARMLGLDGVVDIAHRAEDLLGALRDGRRTATKDLIDLLLVSAESISRSLPGVAQPLAPDELAEIVAALDGAVAGDDPVTVPRLRSLVLAREDRLPAIGPYARQRPLAIAPDRRTHLVDLALILHLACGSAAGRHLLVLQRHRSGSTKTGGDFGTLQKTVIKRLWFRRGKTRLAC